MDRPILFSGDMVRRIIECGKTQTRRAFKPQPMESHPHHILDYVTWKKVDCKLVAFPFHVVKYCPYGRTGDHLWVRETWCPVDDTEFGGEKWIDYRATPRYESSHPAGWENAPDDLEALKWHPSIYMPRWASRITLEITDISAERIQDISEKDAIAEGIERISEAPHFAWRDYSGNGQMLSPIMSYHSLWDSINEKRGYGWDANPWVWVIEFRKVQNGEN